jgi:F-type H+-transporting ATPase subunit gamma
MTSLKDLKNRTRSVKSTCKITQAMKLISASRYNKFNQQIKTANNYTTQLLKVLNRIYYADPQVFEELKGNFVHANGKDGVLLVVLGSDRGLCGTFNANIIKTLKRQLMQYKRKKTACKIVCYGNKIVQYLERNHKAQLKKGGPIANNKNVYTDVYSVSSKFADDLFHLLKTSQFAACDFIYTEHISTLKTNIVAERVLPVDKAKLVVRDSTEVYSFDNSLQNTFHQTVMNLFSAYCHKYYINSITAEYSSRMMAMDNATNNAKSLLTDLKMEYNRKRQAYITKEQIEIISGAEAIS